MSDTRDLLMFQKTWSTSLSAGTRAFKSIDAETEFVGTGIPMSDAHKQMRGKIEFFTLYLVSSTTNPVMTVSFYKSATQPATITCANDVMLDYESLAGADWLAPNGQATQIVTKSGLTVPYFDTDSSKKIHIGIQSSKTIAASGLRILIGFRPDKGE